MVWHNAVFFNCYRRITLRNIQNPLLCDPPVFGKRQVQHEIFILHLLADNIRPYGVPKKVLPVPGADRHEIRTVLAVVIFRQRLGFRVGRSITISLRYLKISQAGSYESRRIPYRRGGYYPPACKHFRNSLAADSHHYAYFTQLNRNCKGFPCKMLKIKSKDL